MKLNYGLTPQEEQPAEAVAYGYKTARESDKYRDFIDLQKTVNTTLQKNSEKQVNKLEDSNLNAVQTGGSWNKSE